jgi:two-component system sensor histidine kinase GlrK
MKVSTRIILGFGILMALAIVAVLYQISVIHEMQSVNHELSAINVRAAETALKMLQLTDEIQDSVLKSYISPGPFYNQLLDEDLKEYADELRQLTETVRSKDEQAQVSHLAFTLQEYLSVLDRERANAGSESDGEVPPTLADAIESLQDETQKTYEAVQKAIPQQVQVAADAGAAAERVSWTLATFAVVAGAVITFLIVRAINEPLRQLTKGTRLIARGEFLHRLPTEGGDEFSEVARDFNAMTKRLGELDLMKKDFVSHVSHELKAPLASMRQVGHLLLQEIPGPLNDQQKNLLRLSNQSAERLSAMVGNLLDVSRLDAGTMEYEINTFDVAAIAKTVVEEFQVQANQKKLAVRVETSHAEMYVECDKDRLLQVLGNLIENAMKFSPANSEVVVRLQHAEQAPERFSKAKSATSRNGFVIISVTDSGPGVPDLHKDKVFAKFHQVKQGKKIAGQGVGLGLAICKTIVDAHGGDIWVEDNPGGGSVFFLVLQTSAKAEALKCVTSV